MSLKSHQVQEVAKRLKIEGLEYEPLNEDLVDHICILIEERMDNGQRFAEALNDVIAEFNPGGINQLQQATVSELKNLTMVKNYIIVAWRNMMRQKVILLINLAGLALGFTSVLLIYRYVDYELSYDELHPNKDQIYRLVTHKVRSNGEAYHSAFTGAPWGPALESDYAEIESSLRMMKYRLPVQVSTKNGVHRFLEPNLIWADHTVFDFFHLPIVAGDNKNPLASPNSVVISQELAKKYFGEENPIGQLLEYEGNFGLQVTAVMKDMPENIHFKADLIGSFNTLGHSFWHIIDNWTILYYYTYLKLAKDHGAEQVEQHLPQFYKKYLGEEAQHYRGELQSLGDIYVHSDLSGELKDNASFLQLMLLVAIAALILLLAITNFISLTAARLFPRFKEVGVRKVMGGLRSDFLLQFITESSVILLISMFAAFALSYLIFPFFQVFTGRSLLLLNELWIWEISTFFLVISMLSILAGLYPAIIMSRLNASKALKGLAIGSRSSRWLREGQVLFQYVICICLIAATFQVSDQMAFIQDKDLGFDEGNILMAPLYISDDLTSHEAALVSNELTQIPGVSHVSVSSHKLVGDQPYGASYAFQVPDRPTDTLSMNRLHVDRHFVETYDIDLVAGRNFSLEFSTDTSAFLVNEQALKVLRIKDPASVLGSHITYSTQNENGNYLRRGEIIGVIGDFNFSSLHTTIAPMVIDIQPARSHFVACKLDYRPSEEIVKDIEETWSALFPESPFTYTMLSDHLSISYQAETQLGQLLKYFSLISVVIAGLGMLGLASGTASKRVKEIGIRKVLGASSKSVTFLLCKSFLILIGLALLVSSPLAYYLLDNWLSGFAYHSPFNWFNLALAAVISLGITLLSVGVITLRAATNDPMRILRSE